MLGFPPSLASKPWVRTVEHDESVPLVRPMIFKRLLARSPNGSTKCRVLRPYTCLEAGYEAIIGPIATSTSASTFFQIGLPIARPQFGGCNKMKLTSLILRRNYLSAVIDREARDAADEAIKAGMSNPVLRVRKVVCVWTPPKPSSPIKPDPPKLEMLTAERP